MVRLMHSSSVVLPELAGPMMAKICFSGISSVISRRAGLAAVADRNVVEADVGLHGRSTTSCASGDRPAGRWPGC